MDGDGFLLFADKCGIWSRLFYGVAQKKARPKKMASDNRSERGVARPPRRSSLWTSSERGGKSGEYKYALRSPGPDGRGEALVARRYGVELGEENICCTWVPGRPGHLPLSSQSGDTALGPFGLSDFPRRLSGGSAELYNLDPLRGESFLQRPRDAIPECVAHRAKLMNDLLPRIRWRPRPQCSNMSFGSQKIRNRRRATKRVRESFSKKKSAGCSSPLRSDGTWGGEFNSL
jgi:hypothetical protein